MVLFTRVLFTTGVLFILRHCSSSATVHPGYCSCGWLVELASCPLDGDLMAQVPRKHCWSAVLFTWTVPMTWRAGGKIIIRSNLLFTRVLFTRVTVHAGGTVHSQALFILGYCSSGVLFMWMAGRACFLSVGWRSDGSSTTKTLLKCSYCSHEQ
jgi:hypothetical protein